MFGRLPFSIHISASITEAAVQDRLNLSPEQRKKVAELAGQRDAKLAEMQTQAKRDGASTWTRQQEITREFEKQVGAELSQEQQKQWSSLKQLEFACFSGPA
jgi:hypothetical protein